MKEITDEALSAMRPNLSACSPLVQSLVVRIDRVERERNTREEESTGRYFALAKVCQEKANLMIENAALRERIKRMEEALDRIAKEKGPVNSYGYPCCQSAQIAQAALKEGSNP